MSTQELQLHWPEWEIVRPLGEGAFGKVYEIKRGEGELEERAALKVIRIPQSESEVKYLISEGADEASVSAHFKELAGQLSNEIATQAKLKGNSNIVSYEDRKIIPDEDGVGYTILIRMELLTSLLDHMTAHPMSHDDVLRLGLDMSKALLLCERHHIIHRDIKPQNIFISPNGDYKLGDFGVARQLEQTTNNLSRKGTYNYMAPEVFHGRPSNATVDIYSLGIVLYTLLNGNRAPFLPPPPAALPNAKERETAQHKRLSGEPLPPLPGVPAVLNELILRMCAFEPKERYQNARELAEAMEGVAYELRADKTVSLFSWIGATTPDVMPPSDELTDEPSRWIDGTPSREPEPVQIPELIKDKPEQAKRPRSKKRLLVAVSAVLGAFLLIAVISLGSISGFIKKGTGERIISDSEAAQLDEIDCILVFGSTVFPDGSASHVLEDRMRRGISLCDQGVASVILVSGDHGQQEYDETSVMKQYAVDHGVPSSAVFMDHAGFTLYDSLYRAKEVFQAKRIVIATNSSQMATALYIAQQIGLDAWGVPSDYRTYVNAPGTGISGFLERISSFFKCATNAKPTFIGEPIPLTLDGDVTNEENVTFVPSDGNNVQPIAETQSTAAGTATEATTTQAETINTTTGRTKASTKTNREAKSLTREDAENYKLVIQRIFQSVIQYGESLGLTYSDAPPGGGVYQDEYYNLNDSRSYQTLIKKQFDDGYYYNAYHYGEEDPPRTFQVIAQFSQWFAVNNGPYYWDHTLSLYDDYSLKDLENMFGYNDPTQSREGLKPPYIRIYIILNRW